MFAGNQLLAPPIGSLEGTVSVRERERERERESDGEMRVIDGDQRVKKEKEIGLILWA
jgi:hypothetical protein